MHKHTKVKKFPTFKHYHAGITSFICMLISTALCIGTVSTSSADTVFGLGVRLNFFISLFTSFTGIVMSVIGFYSSDPNKILGITSFILNWVVILFTGLMLYFFN